MGDLAQKTAAARSCRARTLFAEMHMLRARDGRVEVLELGTSELQQQHNHVLFFLEYL